MSTKAEHRKAEGIARAEEGVGESWNADAFEAAKRAAQSLLIFTADDVWDQGLARPPQGTPSAMGGVMRRIVSSGAARRTPFMVSSRRNHAPALALYVSLIATDPCNKCDQHGWLWDVQGAVVKGQFCDCPLGRHPDFVGLYLDYIQSLGRVL